MTKYLVVARQWNDDAGKVEPYIAGEFSKYHLARLFARAYEAEYNTVTTIMGADTILSTLEQTMAQ